MRKCSMCKQVKQMEEFPSGKTGYCRDCGRLYAHQRWHENRYDPMFLLSKSCDQAVQRGKVTTGKYANVPCDWESGAKMRDDLVEVAPFVADWLNQGEIYARTKNLNDRPTLDRIDNSKGYSLSNIQVLSYLDNTLKATQKPVRDINMSTGMKRTFESQKIAERILGKQGYRMMNGGLCMSPDGEHHLIYSDSVYNDKSRLVCNRYEGMNRGEITASIKAKLARYRAIVDGLKQAK